MREAGWAADGRQIVCTQPRRVAATSVAARVASETATKLGEEVGYAVRFEDCTHPVHTRLKYTTPGLLFRECMRDPLLSRYSVIMVDEAHERGVYTDLLVALLKKIRRMRPELRIIVSSATMDAEAFARYFDPAYAGKPTENVAILSLEGRSFPVEVAYTPTPVPDYVTAAVEAAWSIHMTQPIGDILVFLTGRDEIQTALQALQDRYTALPPGSLPMLLLPLYAGLAPSEQGAVFLPAPRGTRKVIVATNVAEASLTIDGIVYVIDAGFTKEKQLDIATGMDVLAVVPASQAALAQRAGRAGRTAPGKCLRLFPEAQLAALPKGPVPELVRCDVAPYLLQLKALGIDNLARFDFVPPAPSADAMASALTYLASLEALDEHGRLLPLGERLAEAPLDPMMARAVRRFAYAAPLRSAGRVHRRAADHCGDDVGRLAVYRVRVRPVDGRRGRDLSAQVCGRRRRPPHAAQRVQRICASSHRAAVAQVGGQVRPLVCVAAARTGDPCAAQKVRHAPLAAPAGEQRRCDQGAQVPRRRPL